MIKIFLKSSNITFDKKNNIVTSNNSSFLEDIDSNKLELENFDLEIDKSSLGQILQFLLIKKKISMK